MIKNKRALSGIKILIIAIVIVIILIVIGYFIFLTGSSTKKNAENSDNMGVANTPALIINLEENMLKEQGCVQGSILILEDMKFFEEPKDFDVIRKETYENKEVCYIRNKEGKQYYITLNGEELFEVRSENGQRIVNPVQRLVI